MTEQKQVTVPIINKKMTLTQNGTQPTGTMGHGDVWLNVYKNMCYQYDMPRNMWVAVGSNSADKYVIKDQIPAKTSMEALNESLTKSYDEAIKGATELSSSLFGANLITKKATELFSSLVGANLITKKEVLDAIGVEPEFSGELGQIIGLATPQPAKECVTKDLVSSLPEVKGRGGLLADPLEDVDHRYLGSKPREWSEISSRPPPTPLPAVLGTWARPHSEGRLDWERDGFAKSNVANINMQINTLVLNPSYMSTVVIKEDKTESDYDRAMALVE